MDLNFLSNFLNSLSNSGLGLNWIDYFLILILLFYAIQGFGLGFISSFLDFLSFASSFILGLYFYFYIGKFFVSFFKIPQGFANAIGFLFIAVIAQIIINHFLKFFVSKALGTTNFQSERFKILNGFLGIIPGFLSGLLLISFILTLIVALPFSKFLKDSVSEARLGGALVSNTQGLARDLNNVFGGAVNETLSFLTVEPQSNSIVNLNFKTNNISVDKLAEQKMFEMVNNERVKVRLFKLAFSSLLTEVGRAHCEDMFKKGYFSHYTLEGLSPFDRITQAGINFTYAGENLALAPSPDLAMKGLMQSSGHKANILSVNFKTLGVGVIDGEIYGEMFCQEFTD